MAKPVVNDEECIVCGICESVCPADPCVFEMGDETANVVNPDACTDCGECVENCPTDAIKME